MLLNERRDGAVEYDREARVLDVPTHDPQRLWKQLLGRSAYAREPVLAAGDDRRGGAVAEQRGSYDRRRIVAIEPDRDRAGLDGDQQPAATGICRCEAGGEREAVASARAAEAEHRHPADVLAEADAASDPRFETRCGDAGRRNCDNAVNVLRCEARLFDCGRGRVAEQLLRPFPIEGVAVIPALAPQVPPGPGGEVGVEVGAL